MKIAIRTKGGPFVGLGHVSRCLNLASALVKRSAIPIFLIDRDPDLRDFIARRGFAVSEVCPLNDPIETAQSAGRIGAIALVADSHEFTTEYWVAWRDR